MGLDILLVAVPRLIGAGGGPAADWARGGKIRGVLQSEHCVDENLLLVAVEAHDIPAYPWLGLGMLRARREREQHRQAQCTTLRPRHAGKRATVRSGPCSFAHPSTLQGEVDESKARQWQQNR